MRNFRNLRIWQMAVEQVITIYSVTQSFPPEEKFGLSSQMRRAGVSIASNIAEGCGRNSDPDLMRFLDISMGSLLELETQIEISKRLGYIALDNAQLVTHKLVHLQVAINNYKRFLKSTPNPAQP